MSWWNKYSEGQVTQAIGNALSGGASLIHQASVTLDHADILSAPSVYPMLVAPTETPNYAVTGPTQMPVPLMVNFGPLLRTGEPYVGVGVAGGEPHAVLVWGADFSIVAAAASKDGDADLAGAVIRTALEVASASVSTARYWWRGGILDVDVYRRGDFLDNGLYFALVNDAATLTGGDPGDTWRISCAFMFWDQTENRYLTTVESGWDEDTRTFI